MATIERKQLAALSAAALLAMCMAPAQAQELRAAPLVQDIAFVRGCWVWKEAANERVLAFLRLLPPIQDADSFDGQVQGTENSYAGTSKWLSFDSDGSNATVVYAPDARPEDYFRDRSQMYNPPMPAGLYRAVYERTDFRRALLIVEGSEESLRIFTTLRGGTEAHDLFNGQRDGCD